MKTRALLASLLLSLSGCATTSAAPPAVPPAPAEPAPLAYATLGQSVRVDGPRVTPLEVLEDSRCPMNARCVWAGQVRLRIAVELGAGRTEREITSGIPIEVADGRLELVEVQPDRVAGEPLDPSHYRFGFRFAGGL